MARQPNDRPARPLGRRLIASLLAVTLATTPLVSHPADLNAEMQAMFNDLGALGNVTTPGLHALMHCILAYKSLPPAEREAWKALLDHYVFGAADPALHIPAERRGVLGTPTPEMVATMWQKLKQAG